MERLSRRFVGHLVRGQLAQLFVNQRKQFLGGRSFALLDAIQDAGDFAHRRLFTKIRERKEA